MLGRDVTSSASSAAPSASNSAASASCRSRRRSAVTGLEMADEALESQTIAVGPKPRHHSHRHVREQRATPLRLTGENVREMYLDERHPDGEEGIAHREAGMRERGRVDHGAVGLTLRPLIAPTKPPSPVARAQLPLN